MADNTTHLRWWTCVPAWPLNQNDRFYRILRHVFSDHTTNFQRKTGKWSGFYTERDERHQVVGLFHAFGALPTNDWAEQLLIAAKIVFAPPIRSVRWQYELRGKTSAGKQRHADIALLIEDASGPEDLLVVLFEAKRAGGTPGKKDTEELQSYLAIHHLSAYKRKHVSLLIDEIDLHKVREPVLTWQKLCEIQVACFTRLTIDEPVKVILLSLLQDNWDWHLRTGKRISLPAKPTDLNTFPRLQLLVEGLYTVALARQRLPLPDVPKWLLAEPTIRVYKEAKEPANDEAALW
jgi:hypothetical protein